MRAKLQFVLSITIFFSGFSAIAQKAYWEPILSTTFVNKNQTCKDQSLLYRLDEAQFSKALGKIGGQAIHEVKFPDLEGKINSFSVRETAVLHPELSKKYPQIHSFTGISADNKLKIKFSYSHNGLQGMVMDYKKEQTIFFQKDGTTNVYRVYGDALPSSTSKFVCETAKPPTAVMGPMSRNLVDRQTLRTYRIAVSASGEYTNYHGGTVADALAAINATLTRVNAVFEIDLGVRLQLVANNDQIIFTNAEDDPYSGNLNSQVQNTLTTIIGEENYDVGHLFHKDNNNGNAGFIGSVCNDGRKGSAFSSGVDPIGDRFDLDYVSHELGHQFGANHTWSFETEGTGVQVEPASGTTIMGYAGIVNGNNVASNGDDYFHHVSIVQIQEYLQSTSCAQNTDLTNTPPVIISQPDYTIPISTAFVLSGNATDADGDTLTYTWEQIDNGVVVTSSFGPENTSGANFRSVPPTTNPERYFPRLSRILTGNLELENPATDSAWETVSNVKRDLNFALTVRDNNIEGGQVTSDSIKVAVENTAGPFRVTSQASNEVYTAGDLQFITWDVANTNLPPINTETVDILFSTDGGERFTTVLASSVPNTGIAKIQWPGIATTNARVMIKATNSIFLAVNSSNFTIEASQAILDFDDLTFDTCAPNNITIPFVYEAFEGFSETMNLSVVTDEPFTTSFSQPSVSETNTEVTLVLDNIANIATGSYLVEVLATGTSFSTSVVVEVNVFDTNFETIALTLPEDTSIGANVNPEFTWQENTNAASYDIEIAEDESFTAIVESATVPFASYQSTLLVPETLYYWRVRPKNQCGEGVFGIPFSFTTTVVNCASFDGNNLPQEISSEETQIITSSLFLVEDLRVVDINVNLEISHTYLEDLTVTLISPSGTRVTLLSKNCGNSNNIIAVFDDDGLPLGCSGNPAISGTVQPLGSLSSFNGESTLGEWILEVEDSAVSDGGALDAFSLEVCVEGNFRPDDDGDGVFDDGDDLCLGTPKGTLVDTSGCPLNVFPVNNFSIAVTDESCRNNNDGSIIIVASNTAITYQANLVSDITDSSSFTEETVFSNLTAGTYQLCITGTDEVLTYRETCYEITINQPEELGVLTNLLASENQVVLQLSGGNLYNIELNGLTTQTLENEVPVNLQPGLNTLKISTGLQCQGVFETTFFIGDSPVIVPNPANNWITISSQFKDQTILLHVFTADGRVVKRQVIQVEGYDFELNISEFANGLYYLVLEAEGISQTSKLIKR